MIVAAIGRVGETFRNIQTAVSDKCGY